MPSLKGKRVLVIEDEFFVADELVDTIRVAGGIVVGPFARMSDGVQALDKDVHLGVLDVNVRDGVTYPLATKLYERCIPFVFATSQSVEVEPMEWRSHARITKPYHPNEVIRWLVNAVS